MRPTKTALLGYGRWGKNLARNIAAGESTQLVAIADPAPMSRHGAARSYPGVEIYSSVEEVLEDPQLEAVVVATPATTHGSLALQILAAGRHVLVEKPLALSVEAATAIVAAAEEHGLIAMVGHTFLYSPAVWRLRDYIDTGELGPLRYLYSQRLNLGTIRQDCDALWNFAPHDVSIILYLLQDRPVTVTASSLTVLQEDIADVVFALLMFESGVGAHIHVSWLDPRKVRQLTVVGGTKMVVYDDVSVDRKISLHDSTAAAQNLADLDGSDSLAEYHWQTRAGDITIPKLRMEEPLRLQIEDFGTCCRSGKPPVAHSRHALEVVRVLSAIDASAAAGGCPVDIRW